MRRRRYFDDLDDRRLCRDPIDGKFGGICAGIGRYLDVPNALVRLVTIVAFFMAPQVILIGYGLMYLVLDEQA